MPSYNWCESDKESSAAPSESNDLNGVPMYHDDASFNGVDGDTHLTCQHGKPPARRVASKGLNTGCRFLSCPNKENDACRFVHWIDAEWEGNAARTIRYMWNKRLALIKELKKADAGWNKALTDNRLYELEMRLNDKVHIREHEERVRAAKARELLLMLITLSVMLVIGSVMVGAFHMY